ncbi:MAG: tetratricopeptide repeat protein [Elusimicrobiaceae bacterium]|nr:tetratricopeptide repeat protein [Elusimicrobiaceae bacterium]
MFDKALAAAGPTPLFSNKSADVLDVYILTAAELNARGDPVTAEKILRQVYRYRPDSPWLLLELSYIEARKGDTAGALELLDRARRRSAPQGASEAYARTGDIYFNTGAYARAGEMYRRALELNPVQQLALDGQAALRAMKTGPGGTGDNEGEGLWHQ